MSDPQLAELTGLAQGMLADGALNDAEIRFLQSWLAASDSARNHPRAVGLIRRITDALADGVIDEDERADLRDTLMALTRDRLDLAALEPGADLPLTDPAPQITFTGQRFCFTGTFDAGGRIHCETLTEARGGLCGGLTPQTDYLVVGSYAGRDWSTSGFARKIRQAQEWAADGHPIAILSEAHWRQAIGI